MIRKGLLILALTGTLSVQAQELRQELMMPDSTLHLPALNSLGQMPYINRWPMSYAGLTGWYDWGLHQGMNVSLGASVLTSFGNKYMPKGAGFAQNMSGMYAWPLNDKLSLAAGGYLINADWGGYHLRDVGFSAVLGYRFDDHWEGYVYGQKSLMAPKVMWPVYDMNGLGDRIGAALRYNFSPSFSVQLNVERYKTSVR